MKRLGALLVFLLAFVLTSYGQIPDPGKTDTNTIGTYSMLTGASIGTDCFGVWYKNFSVPTLPGDAVITAIYPVAVVDGTGSGVQSNIRYSTSIYPNCTNGTTLQISGLPFTTKKLYGSSLGTSTSVLSSLVIQTAFFQTLFNTGMTNRGHTYVAAAAIYYTSATPKIDQYASPPVAVPAGTGVAWSLPTAFDQTGSTLTPPNCGGIFGNACGWAYGSLPFRITNSLHGLINHPDAEHFNGTMTISLQKMNVKNVCTSPTLNVPTFQLQYKVVNGIPIGLSDATYVSQDCLSPRIPYYVQLYDLSSKLVSADNWYVTNTYSGLIDIGDMQAQKFNGPVTVAIPQGIISTPVTNQTITQPAGTSLDIYGTVNFHGTVGYTTPPAFTLVQASTVQVNGSTASYPLTVNGIINASAGFCYASCVGVTDGQTLVYNSSAHAFVPGSVSVTFPSLYYQTVEVGGTATGQRQALNFDSNSFALNDSVAPSVTTVVLKDQPGFLGGTFTNITSMQVNQKGIIQSITTNGAYPAGTISFSGFNSIWDSTYSFSTTYPTSIPITAVVVCSPQASLPLDVHLGACWAVGNTVYAKLVNVSGNSTGNVFVPANTINFRVLN